MPSDSNDLGLLFELNSLIFQESPDLLSGLNTVHNRHVKVCEDNFVGETKLSGRDQLVKALLAGDAVVYLVLCVYSTSEKH